MKSRIGTGLLMLAVFLPAATTPLMAEITCTAPPGLTDISQMVGGESRGPAGSTTYLFSGTKGESYTVRCSMVDETPGVTVAVGALIDDVTDNGDGTIDISVDFTGFAEGASPIDSGMQPGPPPGGGQCPQLPDIPPGMPRPGDYPDGCPWPGELQAQFDRPEAFGLSIMPCGLGEMPAEVCGTWMSTNVFQWQFKKPTPASPKLGFVLNGPASTIGLFRMHMPASALEVMSRFSGQNLTADDLALYVDGAQSGLSITALDDGGILINISTALTPGNHTFVPGDQGEEVQSAQVRAASDVSKEVSVGPQAALSLTAASSTGKIGKTVSLFGWLKGGAAKVPVHLACKFKPSKGSKGKAGSQALNTKTVSDGYFSKNVKSKYEGTMTCRASAAKKKSATAKITFSK